jgi:hypothetical protein
VGTGHVLGVVTFTNRSTTICTLDGYPGLQMLDAAGQRIGTRVFHVTGFTGSPAPKRSVVLAPRAEASFEVGYADSTGYGTETCPISALVEVTPPGDKTPIIISWHIGPYGGNIPDLQCGEIRVSRVFAGTNPSAIVPAG